MTRLVIDVESTSVLDLRKVGAAKYWAHPETHVVCVVYKIGDQPPVIWRPGDGFLAEIWWHEWTREYRIVAHNYLFEWHCWEQKLAPLYGWPMPKIEQFDCTMARALYWGLPAALGDVTEALNLPVQKDKTGEALMKRMARPRSLKPLTWWHETDPAKFQRLVDYCIQDVEAEALLDDALPPLPDREREIFLLDGEINRRGIRIDRPLVHALRKITQDEGARLNGEMSRLTSGRINSTNKVAAISTELRGRHGIVVPSLGKEDVKLLLASPIGGTPRAILETRLEAAKASTKKLVAMDAGADEDDRCRGCLQYGGAGRTLRWAGRRVQPQNVPRAFFKDPAPIIDLVMAGVSASELSMFLDRSVMDAVAALLRPCLVPSPGHLFVSGDLAQIEARVVAWLAGQQDVLDVFASGEDVYRYTAARIGSDDRQLGKALTLGCGFGMGPEKFRETAGKPPYNVKLTLEWATKNVHAWRAANKKIVSLWWDTDAAARRVAQAGHGYSERVGDFLTLRKTRKAMRIVLPSGREITYHEIRCEPGEDGYDELSYMGVHPKTKRWERIRTYGGRLVENTTQAVARDVMAEVMLSLRRDHFRIIGTVHDELIAEEVEGCAQLALDHMLKTMRTTPAWAPGLPVEAEGWFGPRYRKG